MGLATQYIILTIVSRLVIAKSVNGAYEWLLDYVGQDIILRVSNMNAADMAKELADLYGLKYATQVNLEAAINNMLTDVIHRGRGVSNQELKTFIQEILDTIIPWKADV